MRIELLTAPNRYGTAAHFTTALAQALQPHIELTVRPAAEALTTTADLTLSFSDIHVGGRPLAEITGIPHISLLLDPAIYSLHHFQSSLSHVTYVDQTDGEMLECLNLDNHMFMPHAIEKGIYAKKGGERPYRFVFFGSCLEVEQQPIYPRRSFFEHLVEQKVPAEAMIYTHLEQERAVRAHDRIALLQQFDTAELHVFGEGNWREHLAHATIHPPLSFVKSLEVMKQSRWVINTTARFHRALHERLLYGLALGCEVLTTYNPLVEELFGGMVQTYRPHEKVGALTPSTEEGQAYVSEHHTWEARLPDLIALIERVA